jgi:segregation and condensation protein A
MSDFVIETDEFNGPVGKLLEMIRDRKLYINDISLARVTDAYINHIAENEESLDSMAEFVRVAATLVLAKSKALLPEKTTDTQEEEIDQLEERLRAYKLTKRRAETLQDKFGKNPLYHTQQTQRQTQSVFAPGSTLTVSKIAEAVAGCLIDLPDSALDETSIENKISLQEELDRLQKRCQSLGDTTFSRITRSESKHHQVVTFVAILELIKVNKVTARQHKNFDTITIKSINE